MEVHHKICFIKVSIKNNYKMRWWWWNGDVNYKFSIDDKKVKFANFINYKNRSLTCQWSVLKKNSNPEPILGKNEITLIG